MVTKQLRWLREYSEILGQQKRLLKFDLEEIMYTHNEIFMKDINNSRDFGAKSFASHEQLGRADRRSSINSFSENVEQVKSKFSQPLANMKLISERSKSFKQSTEFKDNDQEMRLFQSNNLIKTVKDTINLVEGLQTEALTQRLCYQIFSGDKSGFFEKLQVNE